MRMLVNHLTRMQPGYICVAGIDSETGAHVRPILPGSRLRAVLLCRHGGPFDIACEVDLGETWAFGNPPETEDYLFETKKALRLKDAAPDEFWTALRRVARPTLRDIFGDSLKPQGRSYAVDLGTGRASLGCLLPRTPPLLQVVDFGRVRLSLADGSATALLPVTDVRLFEEDHQTIRKDVVEQVASRIKRGVGLILGVGLTRPWQKPGDPAPRHWLQVNNIHLADDPTWKEKR